MHFLRTNPTDARLALLASADFAPVFDGNVMRFDPGTASARGTIDPVFGLVFLKLAVPEDFEFLVE